MGLDIYGSVFQFGLRIIDGGVVLMIIDVFQFGLRILDVFQFSSG